MLYGVTENAGLKNAGPKLQGCKTLEKAFMDSQIYYFIHVRCCSTTACVCLTILCRSLQVSKESEQIQMSGLNTS